MEINEGKRQEAVDKFVALAGVEVASAEQLVDATLNAHVDEALELIVGTGPVPSSVTSLRADLIRYACRRVGRILSEREVELLFRIPRSAARSILTNARATYEQELRQQALLRMRQDATVTSTGSVETGEKWRLRFTESATYETAWSEIVRLHLQDVAEPSALQRSFEMTRTVHRDSGDIDTLSSLGLSAPPPEVSRRRR
ncbi:MAG TPA: hypothetical protein VFW71_07135 [Actinomycetota bacterium]|nr:hypothetical protein [Actinomycetota bacterium]